MSRWELSRDSKVRCDAQFNCERVFNGVHLGGTFLVKNTHSPPDVFMDSVRFLSAHRLVHNKLENPVHDSLTFSSDALWEIANMAVSAAAVRIPPWETFFCSTFAENFGVPPKGRRCNFTNIKKIGKFQFCAQLESAPRPKMSKKPRSDALMRAFCVNRPRIRLSAPALTEWHLAVKHGRATERQTAESLRWSAPQSYIFPVAVIFRKGVADVESHQIVR